MSAKQNTPSRASTKNRANPANPSCRYCKQQQSAKVQLVRISDSDLGEVLNELCPPGMFGMAESELSEWICLECKRVLEKTSEVATKVARARQQIVDYTNGIPFRTAITGGGGDSEIASTSRKRARTTEQVLAITATDEKKNRTTLVVSAPVKDKYAGPLLEDSSTTRLRERREALRSRMKDREDSSTDEQEGSARVVRTVRAVFQPPAANPGEEEAEDQQEPIHEVVCVDELEIVFKAKVVDKRVPDILTPAPSDEDDSRTPSPCSSSGSSGSEPDLNMVLKDPSHRCEHCSLMFLTQQQLGWHLRTHTGRGSIRCRLCPGVLPKVSSFLEHQTREHPLLRRTYCILCNEYFRAGCRAAHDHLHMRTRMKYACSFCPLIFYNHKQQKRHRQHFHNDWKLMCRMAPNTEQN